MVRAINILAFFLFHRFSDARVLHIRFITDTVRVSAFKEGEITINRLSSFFFLPLFYPCRCVLLIFVVQMKPLLKITYFFFIVNQ